MDLTSRTTRLLQQDALRWRCLQLARQLNLPDWYLGAGFLRNAIWDQLHQLPMTALNDIDLVYFDASDINTAREQQAEAWLQQQLPGYRFEVRNQARMHLLHGHAPYRDCADGISRWVEIPTCVGVRLQSNDQLSFTTAFGLAANWSFAGRDESALPQTDGFYRTSQAKKLAATVATTADMLANTDDSKLK